MRNTAAGVGAQTRAVQILAHTEEDDSQHGGLHAPSRIRKQTHTYNPIALREERERAHTNYARVHTTTANLRKLTRISFSAYTRLDTRIHVRMCVWVCVYTGEVKGVQVGPLSPRERESEAISPPRANQRCQDERRRRRVRVLGPD